MNGARVKLGRKRDLAIANATFAEQFPRYRSNSS